MLEAEATGTSPVETSIPNPPPADVETDPPREADAAEAGAEGEEDAEQPEGERVAAPEAEDQPKKEESWQERRMARLTYEAREAQRERDALREKLAKYEQPAGDQEPQGDQSQQFGEDEVERRVAERATQIAQANAFNEACNGVFEQGTKEFPDFEATLKNFVPLGGLSPGVIQAAIEIGDAHRVLYNLGRDQNEAARILEMPPLKQVVALAKLAAKPAPTTAISKAPDPIKPIAGKGKVDADPDKLSMDEWIKLHDAGKIH